MKKIKLLSVMLITLLCMTLGVNASEKTETLKQSCTTEDITCNYKEKDTSKLPNIYVFRGNGCGYCQKLIAYLSSIYNDISDKVNIVVYEVGENKDNWAIYEKSAAKFGDTVKGYPYLIIGKKRFDGYSTEYDKSILSAIEKLAGSEEKYDVVNDVKKGNIDLIKDIDDSVPPSKTGAVVAFIFGVVVVIGILTGYHILKK